MTLGGGPVLSLITRVMASSMWCGSPAAESPGLPVTGGPVACVCCIPDAVAAIYLSTLVTLLHVLDIMESVARSMTGSTFGRVATTFATPDALPADWDPCGRGIR